MEYNEIRQDIHSNGIQTERNKEEKKLGGVHMYEVGKKRPDGKFNVWRKVQIDNYWWEWIIAGVFDSFTEASDFTNTKNYSRMRRQKPAYKVNQDA